MSYLALARKWRPKKFPDVVGQDHVVAALSNALTTKRVHHAFLFTGTRGVGKTTLARIFAKALNCETGVSAEPCGECDICKSVDEGIFIDLIEVDAASRTKVDDTRDLLDNVQYTPTRGRFKVYLIDEVHMLSTHSFNALLKTLEEPPEHVKFLLATTNPQKLPTTILSRCIQFNLKAVDQAQISKQLEKILTCEEISFAGEALEIIARSASGSVRDALSLLDQAIAFSNSNVQVEAVRAMLGMIDEELVQDLLKAIIACDNAAAMASVDALAERGGDYVSALDELISAIHHVSLFQFSPRLLQWKGVDVQRIEALSAAADAETLQLLYQIAILCKRDFEFAPDPRTGFEVAIMRMIAFTPNAGNTKPPATQGTVSHGGYGSATAEHPGETRAAKQEAALMEGEVPQVPAPTAQPADADDAQSSQQQVWTVDDLQQLLVPENWRKLVEGGGISGISRELLVNMLPTDCDGNLLSVALTHGSRHLYNEERRKKLAALLQEKTGLRIELAVKVSDQRETGQLAKTPAECVQAEQADREAQAKQRFHGDPNVQKMIHLFNAEVIDESIQPGPAN